MQARPRWCGLLKADSGTVTVHGFNVADKPGAVRESINNIHHGYWVAVTVLMALRPLANQRRETLNGRLIGTFLGAVIALLAVLFLPVWGAVIVAVLCLFFLVWYSMGGAYLMQALVLTPMLLIFASLGDVERGFELTIERVIFTVMGIAAAVLVALLLRRWESRREAVSG